MERSIEDGESFGKIDDERGGNYKVGMGEESPQEEEEDKESLRRIDSGTSYRSYDIADLYNDEVCEYEEKPDFRYLSNSYRWITRSYQRRLASSTRSSSMSSEINDNKKKTTASRLIRPLQDFIPSLMHVSISTWDWVHNPMTVKLLGESFHTNDLLTASAELLGEGDFGTTYKATFMPVKLLGKPDFGTKSKALKFGSAVAAALFKKRKEKVEVKEKVVVVKRLNIRSQEYLRQLSRLRHTHIISPLAWSRYMVCQPWQDKSNNREVLLIYKFVQGGSIHSILHSGGDRPSWNDRFRWILEVARGLDYIHDRSMVHGNLKSSNVLLKYDGQACITDIAIFKFVTKRDGEYRSYPSPQESQNPTKETDIYAFGVFIFEVLTCENPREYQDVLQYVEWVRATWVEEPDSPEVVKELLHLGHICTEEKQSHRPSMAQVKQMIEDMMTGQSDNQYVFPLDESMHVGNKDDDEIAFHDKAIITSEEKIATSLMVIQEEEESTSLDDEDNLKASESHLLLEDHEEEEDVEQFDIGIPPGHCPDGQLKEYQISVINGLAGGLREVIVSDTPFVEVIQHARKFTASLVSLGAPLEEWNRVAQLVLHAAKQMDGLREQLGGESSESLAHHLSTLHARVEERGHEIKQDESNLESGKQSLAEVQKHQVELKHKMDILQQQMEDLRKEADLIRMEVQPMETSLSRKKSELEIWMGDIGNATQQLEDADAISRLKEATLSGISTFVAGNKCVSSQS